MSRRRFRFLPRNLSHVSVPHVQLSLKTTRFSCCEKRKNSKKENNLCFLPKNAELDLDDRKKF
jgi:hypothetical protein